MSAETKTVLSVGQCRPDGAAIAHFLKTHFSVGLQTADTADQAISALGTQHVDLVLINRKLDIDGSDGLEILQRIRAGDVQPSVPVMLVSNYPEWQARAVSLGAVYGFGKAELSDPGLRDRLKAYLT